MNPTLVHDVETIFRQTAVPVQLECKKPLAVAASMLSRAAAHQMSSTTVVGVLGCDDADAFSSLVMDIGEEYGLEARVRIQVGSYSVRFSRPAVDASPH